MGKSVALDGDLRCAARRVQQFSSTGNVSRHAPGCESPRPSWVDQHGTIQLGTVSRARYTIPSGYVLPLYREPPRARGGWRAARV
jgi:hypothetical protein